MGLLPKFIDEAAGPPAQAVGNTLSNLWELGIGNHIDLWIKKQEVRQQKNLQDYIKRVEEKTQEIPEEFIQEPSLHIVGPAIEASKYYIESEELREMFANLIASSIDNRKIDKTHPAFVEIIKQLSSLDAKVLHNFKSQQEIPLVEIRTTKDSGQFLTIHKHVMNFNNKELFQLHATSLSNLSRLGLLEIDYGVQSASQTAYDYVGSHPAFQQNNPIFLETQRCNPEFKNLIFKRGLCSRTPLCDDFIDICL